MAVRCDNCTKWIHKEEFKGLCKGKLKYAWEKCKDFEDEQGLHKLSRLKG